MRLISMLTVVPLLAVSLHVQASAHMDISPRVQAGQIVLDGYDDDDATLTPVVTVFGYDFGEDPNDPFVSPFPGDPGINALAGSGLTPGSSIGIEVRSDLRYWSGVGAFVQTDAPSNEALMFEFGPSTRTAGTGTGTLPTMFFGPSVGLDGTFHAHLTSYLFGGDGNAIPAGAGPWGAGDGVEAAAGIYMVQIGLVSSDTGIAASNSVWIVFNNGLDEDAHDAAIDALLGVEDNGSGGVPEPASLSLVALAAAALIRRRRM